MGLPPERFEGASAVPRRGPRPSRRRLEKTAWTEEFGAAVTVKTSPPRPRPRQTGPWAVAAPPEDVASLDSLRACELETGAAQSPRPASPDARRSLRAARRVSRSAWP